VLNEEKSEAQIKRPSERNFGVVFSLVFIVISLYSFLNGGNFYFYLIPGFLLLVIAYLFPHSLKIYNVIWFKFGLFLGGIIAPLTMLLIYVFVIMPLGLWIKFRKKDLLKLKRRPQDKSYWITRSYKIGSMKNLF